MKRMYAPAEIYRRHPRMYLATLRVGGYGRACSAWMGLKRQVGTADYGSYAIAFTALYRLPARAPSVPG